MFLEAVQQLEFEKWRDAELYDDIKATKTWDIGHTFLSRLIAKGPSFLKKSRLLHGYSMIFMAFFSCKFNRLHPGSTIKSRV